MRAFWSRVARSPGTCRCMSYVSHARAVVSRRGQRRLRGSWASGTPTSTFFYTTVFAAGLTVDAQAKSERNRQWEKAFARLRDALDRPPQAAPSTAGKPKRERRVSPDLSGHIEDTEWQGVPHAVSMELGDDAALLKHEAALVDSDEAVWKSLRLDSRFPGARALPWPASTGPDVNPYHLPPHSLWAPDALRLSALRRRRTWKKQAMQELCTGLLVHNLITHVGIIRCLGNKDALLKRLSPHIRLAAIKTDAAERTARTEFLTEIDRLHRTPLSSSPDDTYKARTALAHLGIPRYTEDADGDFYDIAKQMNDGITRLLRQCSKGDPAEKASVVAKICHNLLISTSAPDIHTFNVLMAGFALWRRSDLVDDVIAALEPSKIRPNELLCTQILTHYTNQSRPDDFSRFVAKMRGVDNAITLANPSITINEAGCGRLVRINDHKVYQKIYPTPMVFAALIHGVLKFAGFDRALDIYYEMKADGWGLTMPALTRLLADCIRRADWEGGAYVWEEIKRIKANVKPSYVAKAYHHMLSLCSVTGNTVAFNQVLNEVAKRGFDHRSIIKAALITTRWAEQKKHNVAPAWTADNVMIATSAYLKDVKPMDKAVDEEPLDETEFDDDLFTRQLLEEEMAANSSTPDSVQSAKAPQADEKEVWAAWLEHEFGERPRDPEL
ncbi:hypothetical protein BDU57DRAFT_523728 [Ampelomyces quisqualis]|uniref:Pentatricopeptide repeat domain-containing protein n=1 Tax=Ampelomyces quisqualis TaxID=50730 RepID=A0A6A5QBT4_AMPQU|nr:hypothetical protein BDU57DRAFT_523728 [Ampelomyces quisqualis]